MFAAPHSCLLLQGRNCLPLSLSALQLKAAYYTSCVHPHRSMKRQTGHESHAGGSSGPMIATRSATTMFWLQTSSPYGAAPEHYPCHSQQSLYQQPQPPLPRQAPPLRRPLPAAWRPPLGSGRQRCHGCGCAASRTRGSLAACCRCPCDLSITGRAHQQSDTWPNHASRAA